MSIAAKVTAQLEQKAAEAVGVPVLGAGAVNRVGTMRYLATNEVGDVAGDVLFGQHVGTRGLPKDQIRRAGGEPTDLPSGFALVVTADHVHVFDVRFGPRTRVKLKKELGRFDRAGLEAAVQEGTLVTVYHLYSPGQGQDVMFEMLGGSTAGGRYTTELTALIRGSS